MARTLVVAILGVSAITAPVRAGVMVLDAVAQGHYQDLGSGTSGGLNYIVGNVDVSRPFVYHNYFVFDLSAIDIDIVSLTLMAFNPATGTVGADPSETWMLWDVTTDIANLVDGTAGVAGWSDLGSGMGYGGREVFATETDVFIDVTLNAAALADANAATGLWAIGGSITTLDADPVTDEWIFGNTHADFVAPQLIVVLPGPATGVVLAAGVVCVGRRRRRRAGTRAAVENPAVNS